MTKTWDLAIAQLIYFLPSAIPTLYCLWRHRSVEFLGWFFLFGFVLLQVTGSAMILAAGQDGTPSSTAIILLSVGISPLIVGVSGIVHEWAKLCGLVKTKAGNTWSWVIVVLYHLLVLGGITLYAIGASDASKQDKASTGETMAKAGIIVLLLLWLVMCGFFGFLTRLSGGISSAKALYYSLIIALLLLGIRLIYQCVAVFNMQDEIFNPVTGSIALRAVFEFLPGAFILLVLVAGGVMSVHNLAAPYRAVSNDIELA
jgi:hypothetical protein